MNTPKETKEETKTKTHTFLLVSYVDVGKSVLFFNAELNIPFLPTPFRFFLVYLAQFHIFKTKICFYSYSLHTSKGVNYAVFQVTKRIDYKKTGKWYIEWKRVTTSGGASDSEWKQVMQIVNEWQRVTANDNEWQRLTVSGTANENEREQVKQSDFKFQNGIKNRSGSWRIFFIFLYNV